MASSFDGISKTTDRNSFFGRLSVMVGDSAGATIHDVVALEKELDAKVIKPLEGMRDKFHQDPKYSDGIDTVKRIGEVTQAVTNGNDVDNIVTNTTEDDDQNGFFPGL